LIKNIVNLDKSISILLMFEAYSQMHAMNLSTSLINQRTKIIKRAMTEIRKFKIEKQIVDVLNTRIESNV
jgi:hypothetical protein